MMTRRRTRAKVLAAVLRGHLVQHEVVAEEIVLVRGRGRAAGGEAELVAVKVARGDHVMHGNAEQNERKRERLDGQWAAEREGDACVRYDMRIDAMIVGWTRYSQPVDGIDKAILCEVSIVRKERGAGGRTNRERTHNATAEWARRRAATVG